MTSADSANAIQPCHPLGRLWLFTLLACTMLVAALPAQAARLALVIGNDKYASIQQLKNAKNDARLISGVLKSAGFEVTQLNDLGREQFWAAIDTFKGRINKGDEVVFYFAGHGVQIGSNQLLLPTDIVAKGEAQLERDGVSLIGVQDALKDARVAVLLVDACRDNPFPKQGTRSIGGTRGLSPPEPSTGQIIMMSAGRNQKALDTVPGQNTSNGLFTWELAQLIQTPGLEVRQALEQVKDRVDDKARQASHEQRPSVVSDLRGNFFFIAPGANVTIQVTPAPIAAPIATPAPTNTRPVSTDPDTALWYAVEAGGTVDDYSVYLKQYPKGKFVALAKQRVQKLQDEASRAASAAEEADWQSAESGGTEAGYQSYLANYPKGRYAALAQPRMNKARAQAQEQRKREEAEKARIPQVGQVFKDCADCPDMVVLPAGSFTIGSNKGGHEGPAHIVTLARPFAMGKFEVTQGQWKAVMGSNPSHFPQCGDNCPVEQVSWNVAKDFIQKLIQKTGKSYRLPSEAEWEYACRAGGSHEYCGSDSVDTVAWYGSNSGNKTQPVGGKQANAWGLYDMSGNVYEWVHDWYHDNYNGAPVDGSAWESGGEQKDRVLRGGSWSSSPAFLRSAVRYWNTPDIRYSGFGFRVARTVP